MAAAGDPRPLSRDPARQGAAGVTTGELDTAAERFIRSQGGSRPSRATAASPDRSAPRPTRWSCTASRAATSSSRGDILSIDIGVVLDGWVADAAITHPIGNATPIASACWRPPRGTVRRRRAVPARQPPGRRLARRSRRAWSGRLLGDPLAGRARHRARHARGPADPQLRQPAPAGAGGGHGGGDRADGQRRHHVRMGSDNWAVYSQDGSLAAHFEHTVAVTADGRASSPRGTSWSGTAWRRPLRRLSPPANIPPVLLLTVGAEPSPGLPRPSSSSIRSPDHGAMRSAPQSSRCARSARSSAAAVRSS